MSRGLGDVYKRQVSNAVAGNGLEASAQYIKAFEADSADISDKISLYGGNADYISKKATIPQEYIKKSYELSGDGKTPMFFATDKEFLGIIAVADTIKEDSPKAIKELKDMGIETVVSVWPTIDERSENFGEMSDKGYLVTPDRGMAYHMTWMGNTVFFDATNPGAQKFVWEKCKENYYKKGIRCFWLDEAEPEYGPYDFDNYRYYAGPALQCTNTYPVGYAKGFYDGLKAEGEKDVMSLVRCAWAGSQKYGVLTWSGDIHSSFRAMREQLQAGLNMSVAGIPWWTSDIGGFVGGNIKAPYFKELLVRWFAWGCFCPVFRMHGERSPWYEREEEFINNVRQLTSGQDNEVWSFGEDNYEILKKYLFIRERLRPYIRECMKQASLTGAPVMRPLFFDFDGDKTAWETEDEYMFGPDILVAPVMEEKVTQRSVYLPAGATWTDANTGEVYEGGQRVIVPAPLDIIPVFFRDGKKYDIYQ